MTGVVPTAIAVVFLVGLIVERLLVRQRVGPYLALGIPLGADVAPIPEVPSGEGETRLVRWSRRGDLVVYWADAGRSVAPMGLHGSVRFTGDDARKRLEFRWAPPISPLLAAGWVGFVGWSRGEPIVIPFVIVVATLVLWAYRSFALKAAHELRWAWVGAPPSSHQEAP